MLFACCGFIAVVAFLAELLVRLILMDFVVIFFIMDSILVIFFYFLLFI